MVPFQSILWDGTPCSRFSAVLSRSKLSYFKERAPELTSVEENRDSLRCLPKALKAQHLPDKKTGLEEEKPIVEKSSVYACAYKWERGSIFLKNYNIQGRATSMVGFERPWRSIAAEAPFLTQGWRNLVETGELADKDGQ